MKAGRVDKMCCFLFIVYCSLFSAFLLSVMQLLFFEIEKRFFPKPLFLRLLNLRLLYLRPLFLSPLFLSRIRSVAPDAARRLTYRSGLESSPVAGALPPIPLPAVLEPYKSPGADSVEDTLPEDALPEDTLPEDVSPAETLPSEAVLTGAVGTCVFVRAPPSLTDVLSAVYPGMLSSVTQ
jgi:hypothetical protein